MAAHFYNLKAENAGTEEERMAQFAQGNDVVTRAATEEYNGPEEEILEEWSTLGCKPYNAHNKSAFQFKTEVGGHLIFGAVWEHWAKS